MPMATGNGNPVFVDAEGQYREGETLTYRMRDPEGEESEK